MKIIQHTLSFATHFIWHAISCHKWSKQEDQYLGFKNESVDGTLEGVGSWLWFGEVWFIPDYDLVHSWVFLSSFPIL